MRITEKRWVRSTSFKTGPILSKQIIFGMLIDWERATAIYQTVSCIMQPKSAGWGSGRGSGTGSGQGSGWEDEDEDEDQEQDRDEDEDPDDRCETVSCLRLGLALALALLLLLLAADETQSLLRRGKLSVLIISHHVIVTVINFIIIINVHLHHHCLHHHHDWLNFVSRIVIKQKVTRILRYVLIHVKLKKNKQARKPISYRHRGCHCHCLVIAVQSICPGLLAVLQY